MDGSLPRRKLPGFPRVGFHWSHFPPALLRALGRAHPQGSPLSCPALLLLSALQVPPGHPSAPRFPPQSSFDVAQSKY